MKTPEQLHADTGCRFGKPAVCTPRSHPYCHDVVLTSSERLMSSIPTGDMLGLDPAATDTDGDL